MRLNQHISTSKNTRGWEGYVAGAGLKSTDSRRVPCPDCGAKAPARCIGAKGGRVKRVCPGRVQAMKDYLGRGKS